MQQTKMLVETWESVEAEGVEEAKKIADVRVPDGVRMVDCKMCRVGIEHPHSEVLRIKMEKGV